MPSSSSVQVQSPVLPLDAPTCCSAVVAAEAAKGTAVNSSIAEISQVEGFVVIIAMSLTIIIMGEWMGIPVSTSQAVVGAVMGAGLVKGVRNVHFGVFKNIAIAWVSSPTVAGLLTYLVAFATQNYFA